MSNNTSDKRGFVTNDMASAKAMENDFVSKKVEKSSELSAGSRRTQKFKAADHGDGFLKKQTRAKNILIVSDDTTSNQSSIYKAREKVRVEPVKVGDAVALPRKDIKHIIVPKKDNDSLGTLKKDVVASTAPKKEIIGSGPVKRDIVPPITLKKDVISTGAVKKDIISTGALKKDVISTGAVKKDAISTGLVKKDVIYTAAPKKEIISSGIMKKDGEGIAPPKNDVPPILPSKRVVKVPFTTRKIRIKIAPRLMPENKHEDKLDANKVEETKSEVTTSEKLEKIKSKDDKLKSERKENGSSSKLDEKNREIMNSDVTSSVEEKPLAKMARHHSPGSGTAFTVHKYEPGWCPGDLAWGRVGQHPFWPCMIAVDLSTGIFTKTKGVGRGFNAVQRSLHVQFFGDNGRHSWIPTNSVIKYDGKDLFLKFADKVLNGLKKKDKRITSAFIVKPSSKLKWEAAIREADETVPMEREERIELFEELYPMRKTAVKMDPAPKTAANGTKSSAQLVKKRNKRPNPSMDDSSPKQMKIDEQATVKDIEANKKNEPSAPSKVKRGRKKAAKK